MRMSTGRADQMDNPVGISSVSAVTLVTPSSGLRLRLQRAFDVGEIPMVTGASGHPNHAVVAKGGVRKWTARQRSPSIGEAAASTMRLTSTLAAFRSCGRSWVDDMRQVESPGRHGRNHDVGGLFCRSSAPLYATSGTMLTLRRPRWNRRLPDFISQGARRERFIWKTFRKSAVSR